MQSSADLLRVFAQAWVLLRRNWIIVLPPVVVGAASAVLNAFLTRNGYLGWTFLSDLDASGPGAFAAFLSLIVAVGLRILSLLVTISFTTGMAGAAWQRGYASLADGAIALLRDGLRSFFALLILLLVGLGAAALAIPTFGLSVIVYLIFAIYTMPSVIVGHHGASDAIIESLGLAWRNLLVSFYVVAAIVVLAVLGGLLGDTLTGASPLLGMAIAWIIMEIVAAYATLVVVGEYLRLQRTPDQAA